MTNGSPSLLRALRSATPKHDSICAESILRPSRTSLPADKDEGAPYPTPALNALCRLDMLCGLNTHYGLRRSRQLKTSYPERDLPPRHKHILTPYMFSATLERNAHARPSSSLQPASPRPTRPRSTLDPFSSAKLSNTQAVATTSTHPEVARCRLRQRHTQIHVAEDDDVMIAGRKVWLPIHCLRATPRLLRWVRPMYLSHPVLVWPCKWNWDNPFG